MFTAPTAFRAIKQEDPRRRATWALRPLRLRTLFLAGERCDPDTLALGRAELSSGRSIDHWWQTETGWPIVANCLGLEQLPVKPGSPTTAGARLRRARARRAPAREVAAGRDGAICIRLPLPPGTLPTLWNDDERFVDVLPVGASPATT